MKLSNVRLFILFLILSPFGYAAHEPILYPIDKQKVLFSSLKGKWVLINYWAGWCPTCIDEIPEFNAFYQKHQRDPIVLWAVNYDGLPLDKQQLLIQQLNISYPSLAHDPSDALHLGDIKGLPATFVFNPQGVHVETLYGGQTAVNLDKVLQTHGYNNKP